MNYEVSTRSKSRPQRVQKTVNDKRPHANMLRAGPAPGHLAELRTLILNRRRRLFHSSRVTLPFVSMSARWFLDSTTVIWIFGPRLILSNNLSSATLWVLETCLIVGLFPLMIILITASMSSNTYNKAS